MCLHFQTGSQRETVPGSHNSLKIPFSWLNAVSLGLHLSPKDLRHSLTPSKSWSLWLTPWGSSRANNIPTTESHKVTLKDPSQATGILNAAVREAIGEHSLLIGGHFGFFLPLKIASVIYYLHGSFRFLPVNSALSLMKYMRQATYKEQEVYSAHSVGSLIMSTWL